MMTMIIVSISRATMTTEIVKTVQKQLFRVNLSE